MSLVLQSQPVPLSTDPAGIVRIAGTRIPLETVVDAFKRGATAEQIVYDYSSLALEDVYAVITYYLQHRDDVEKYLAERQAAARVVREEMQQRFDSRGIRDRLLARRAKREAGDAAPAGG